MTGRVVEGPVTEAGQTLGVDIEGLLGLQFKSRDMYRGFLRDAERLAVAIEAAARAEVIAEIRAGVEGLAFEVPDEPSASSRFMARALVNRDEVLALLPPTEPK